MFCRNFIIVSKSDHLSNVEVEFLTEFSEKLLSSKWISAVRISYKLEIFWDFFKVLKGLTHSQYTWTNAPIIGYFITND